MNRAAQGERAPTRFGFRTPSTYRSQITMPILTRIAGIAVLAGGLAARAPAAQREPGTIGEANKTTAGTVAGAVTVSAGDYCREYQWTVTVGGKTNETYSTACRQADGSWKVVND
jgi:hypothetical protein